MTKKYSEKLKDPRWQKKRLLILERDNWKCKYCKDHTSELQVHHKKYSGEPWDAEDCDLETVCKYCHEFINSLKVGGDELIEILQGENEHLFCLAIVKNIENSQIYIVVYSKANGIVQLFWGERFEKLLNLMNEKYPSFLTKEKSNG